MSSVQHLTLYTHYTENNFDDDIMHCQGHLLERRHTTVVFFIIIASRFFWYFSLFVLFLYPFGLPCLHIGLSLFHVDENVNDLNEMVHLFYK